MNAIRRDDGSFVIKSGPWEWIKIGTLLAGILGSWYRSETKHAVTVTKIEGRLDSQDKTNEWLSKSVENLKQNKTDIEVVKQRLSDVDRRIGGVDGSLDQVNRRLDEISRQVGRSGT